MNHDRQLALHAPCRSRWLTMIGLALLFAGCQWQQDLSTQYGQRRGDGSDSVNGTAVLADLFGASGFEVMNWRRLSPRLHRHDVIIWAPDRFHAPFPEEVEYLNEWLRESPGRTLVYIGRDYDAAYDYWDAIIPQLSPADVPAARTERAQVRATWSNRRSADLGDCNWFKLSTAHVPQRLERVEGPWATTLGNRAVAIWQQTRLTFPHYERADANDASSTASSTTDDSDQPSNEPGNSPTDDATEDEEEGEDASDREDRQEVAQDKDVTGGEITSDEDIESQEDSSDSPLREDTDVRDDPNEDEDDDDATSLAEEHDGGLTSAIEPLLVANGIPLASRISDPQWAGSQLIVINNGSWLLNLPLLRDSHQLLAQQLIDACGTPDRVCFLECGEGPMTISDSDAELPLMIKALTVWPVNVVVAHFLLVGIIYCFAAFPIFGRPREIIDEHVSDFGKHVNAFGELLERERDEEYAHRQLRYGREWILNVGEARKPPFPPQTS